MWAEKNKKTWRVIFLMVTVLGVWSIQLSKCRYPEAALFLPSESYGWRGGHVLCSALILLTSKAQLRRLARGARGWDSVAHSSLKGNFQFLQLCLRSSSSGGINESKGGERGVWEKKAKEEIEDWWKWINGCDHVKGPGVPQMLGTSQARGERRLTRTGGYGSPWLPS